MLTAPSTINISPPALETMTPHALPSLVLTPLLDFEISAQSKIYPLINFVVSIFNSLNQLKNKIMINLFIFSNVNQLLNQVKQ